jgi:hypothetical protein
MFTRKRSRGSKRTLGSRRSARAKPCPPGYLLRKGYVRRFHNTVRNRGYTVKRGDTVFRVYPKANQVEVKASCIKDRGLPGTLTGPGIGPLKRGELIKYGYSYRLPASLRREALKKAVSEYTALSVYRKLDAVAKLTKRLNHKASSRFEADRDWVKKEYATNGLHAGI